MARKEPAPLTPAQLADLSSDDDSSSWESDHGFEPPVTKAFLSPEEADSILTYHQLRTKLRDYRRMLPKLEQYAKLADGFRSTVDRGNPFSPKPSAPQPRGLTLHLRELQAHEIEDKHLQELAASVNGLDGGTVFVAVDEDDDIGDFLATTLSGTWFLERLIRRDRHAEVYSVLNIAPPFSNDQRPLECKVYSWEGISAKLRQHRKRNLKRLSSRKIFETEMDGQTFIVYTADTEPASEMPADKRHPMSSPSASSPSSGSRARPKPEPTDAQREKARERQRDRRSNKRAEKRDLLLKGTLPRNYDDEIASILADSGSGNNNNSGAKPLPAGAGKKGRRPSPNERSMQFFRALYEMDAASMTFEKWLKVDSKDQLELFVAMKQQEVASLAKHLARLPRMLAHNKTLTNLLDDKLLHIDSDEPWQQMLFSEQREELARDATVLQYGEQVVPMLLDASRRALRASKRRFNTIQEMLATIQQIPYGLGRFHANIEILRKTERFALPQTAAANALRETIAQKEEQGKVSKGQEDRTKILWQEFSKALRQPIDLDPRWSTGSEKKKGAGDGDGEEEDQEGGNGTGPRAFNDMLERLFRHV